MRMVQAHGQEEHVNKWWKRTDVCCLDTQATCPREVWITELTQQRYIVCSHLNHKRFCASCVKTVPPTSLKKYATSFEYATVIHIANSQFSLLRNFLRNAGKCCIQYKIQEMQVTEASPRCFQVKRKKCFNKDNNFSRCYRFCFHRYSTPVLNLYIFQRVQNTVQCCHYCMQEVLDILFIFVDSFPRQLCIIKKPKQLMEQEREKRER